MNIFKTALCMALMALASLQSYANAASNLINGQPSSVEIKRSISKTLNAANLENADQWVSYQVDMEPENGMPCCFQGDNHEGCALDKRSNSWGTSHGNDEDSKVLNLYFKWKDNHPTELFFAGSECAVDAGGSKVLNLTKVSQQQSLDFLKQFVDPNTGSKKLKNKKALAGIALHRGELAHKLLVQLANRSDDKLSRQAVFWLGEARNKAGYESLVDILEDKNRNVNTRAKAVFALSQNSYPDAKRKLVELAMNSKDTKIQSKAIFWLADSKHPETINVIDKVLKSEVSYSVKKKAVFGLSELNTDKSWQRLIEIAKNDEYPRVREKAIFWLSQNHQRNAKPILLDIIYGRNPQSIKIKTVFAMSQLAEPDATDGLLEVMKNAENNKVRRKAIFWLGQSNDPRALTALEDILTASID